jgi:hypothetical protein
MRGLIAEALYGGWAVLALCGVVQQVVYQWCYRDALHASKRLDLSRALIALFAGGALFNGWAWLWYDIWNAGGDPTWMRDLIWVALAGSAIGSFGLVCVLRLCSAFGHLDWTTALAFGAVFVVWSLSG